MVIHLSFGDKYVSIVLHYLINKPYLNSMPF